jgi:uncharacterized membrane protein YkvA (DUF1232 family)
MARESGRRVCGPLISPIQVIPNFIPIIGQMDDVLAVTLGIKYLRRSVPQSVLDECESHSHIHRRKSGIQSSSEFTSISLRAT